MLLGKKWVVLLTAEMPEIALVTLLHQQAHDWHIIPHHPTAKFESHFTATQHILAHLQISPSILQAFSR
jgi:hypothetical protein